MLFHVSLNENKLTTHIFMLLEWLLQSIYVICLLVISCFYIHVTAFFTKM